MGRLVDLLRDRMRMMRADAVAVAHVVEQAFHGAEAVDDDQLETQVRQLFYDLQDARVLDVQRHEYTEDGRLLRGYRWHVVDEGLRREIPLTRAAPDPVERLYADLVDQAWERRPPYGPESA